VEGYARTGKLTVRQLRNHKHFLLFIVSKRILLMIRAINYNEVMIDKDQFMFFAAGHGPPLA
jgi:hypothetical protein